MNQVVVDIADFAVSNDPDATLTTYSLGSCVGVSIWDSAAKVGGLLHYMLPEATLSPGRAESSPAMFCDTGIAALFRAAYALGAAKKRLVVKVAGGAHLLDGESVFNIGKRNYVALRKILWKNEIRVDGEDVGGTVSRNLRLHVGTGAVTIQTRHQEAHL